MVGRRMGLVAVGLVVCQLAAGACAADANAAGTACGLRPGIHGAGGCTDPLPLQVAGIRSVRFILEHTAIADIVADPQQRTQFRATLDLYAAQCVDVVITVRIADPVDGQFDFIPDPTEQAVILADLSTFFSMFADEVDACQIGNEIFGGPGTYRIGGQTAEQWTNTDFDALDSWLAAIAGAVTDGAGSAGASIGLISPALTPGLTRRGAVGAWQPGACGVQPDCETTTCSSPCYAPDALATRLVDFIIAFGNQYCDMIDQHLHVNCLAEIADLINLLEQNPCGLLAATPKRLTSLEWSPSHAARRWLAEPSQAAPGFTNEDEMLRFLERVEWCRIGPGCTLCDPVQPSEWAGFLQRFDTWFVADSGLDLAGFISGALDLMSAAGFEHACYSGLSQLGMQDAARLATVQQCQDVLPANPGDIYIFDITAIRADETVGATGPCDAVWSTVVRSAVEAGFAAYALPQCPLAAGDQNCDGQVDAVDDACWLDCMAGPVAKTSYACRLADLDGDLDADLQDFSRIQQAH